ncbi:hypothetical protein [Aliarcobacter butzleri]|uniref:hypothetical protein n=1 Tax=Aliarcobacter butzleri TaxID=28197 RepID=UPI0012699588|nr:hypothetical protein [Aliarcobacter butzleri]
MNIISEEEKQLLNELIKMEVEFIEGGFKASTERGKMFFSNSLTHFVSTYLEPKYKSKIIPSMSTEYRYLLLGILANIDNKYLNSLIRESLIPTYKNISTSQLLEAIFGKNHV